MKNVLVIDFDDSLAAVIEGLARAGACNVVDWVGNHPACTIQSKRELKYANLRRYPYRPYDKAVYESVHRDFFQYFLFQNRLKKIYAKDYRFYDHLDFFNLYFQFFFHLLTEKKVEIVLFQNLPHLGIDYIVYRIARALNLRTIMFHQSLFSNRFFYVKDIEDFGIFAAMKSRPGGEPAEIRLPRGFKPDLFYMRKQSFASRWLKPDRLKKSLQDAKKLRSQLGPYRRYRRNLEAMTARDCDLSAPYVYFPLHLQPELTTSILGGKYIDQALAIEHLSELLPEGWFIYVKENPKQSSEYLRGVGFFRRLAAIDRVRIVPRGTDTYTLLDHCRFVATVTGTAGWEAICSGKKALVFGKAWYRSLPGVVSYHPGLTLEEILHPVFSHEELEKEVCRMVAKMPTGVVDPDYRVMVAGFDEEANRQSVELAVRRLL